MDKAQVSVINQADLAALAVTYGKQNVIPWTWYDDVALANGNTSPTIQFFSQTQGGAGIAKTNMEQANIFVSGKMFVLQEIQLDVTTPTGAFVAGTVPDMLLATHAEASFTFKINQVQYAQSFVKDLVGGGFFGFGSGLAAGGTTIPYAAPRNVSGYKLNPWLLIPTQTQFNLQFDYNAAPNPAATLQFRPKLKGQLIRLTSA